MAAVAGVLVAGLALAVEPEGFVVLDTAHQPRALVAGPPAARVLVPCAPPGWPRYRTHVELFVDGIGVLLPAGIGGGRSCRTVVSTVDQTGVVQGAGAMTLGGLAAAWGQPIRTDRLLGARGSVRAYVNGRPWAGRVEDVPLGDGAQVVVEIGAVVPPHASYAFPH